MRRWQRLAAISGVTLGTVLVGAGVAYAYFAYTDASNAYAAEAVGAVLVPPTTPTTSVNGSGSITVGWTMPGGQLPGTQYRVTQTSPAPASTVCTVVATSCTATGLTPATAYTFTVAAVLDGWQSTSITTTATTSTPTLSLALHPGPYVAGSASTVTTITALRGGVADTTLNSAMTLSWSGLSASPSGTNPTYPATSITFVSGVATLNSSFTPVRSGTATLTATDATAPSVTGSVTLSVSPGSTAALSVATSPGGATGGTAFATQPRITVVDALGNTVPSDHSTVVLSITPGTPLSGGPGALSGCTQSETAGVVQFSGCAISTVGTGYELTATDGTLTGVTTSAFSVAAGPAVSDAFTVSPGPSTSAVAFATQPAVTLYDAGGNVAVGAVNKVTLAIKSGSGTLACAKNPVTPTAGVATFAGCKITLGTDGTFTLSASVAGLASTTSASFSVYGKATKLVYTTQPKASTGGVALTTQPVLAVEDAAGNTIPGATNAITLGISKGVGTLTCTTNPLVPSAGVAAFSGCVITLGTPGSFKLAATSAGLPTATSIAFNVAGPATKLVFTTQPTASTGGAALTTQPVVAVEDAAGDVVTSASAPVTLAVGTGTGTLACTRDPVVPSSGVATFAGCSIALGTEGSFSLTATEGALSQASAAFTVAGAATKLVITTQPSNATGGATFATQPTIKVEDAGGDVVTTSRAAVTLAVSTGSGTLACTADPLAATSGVATFAGCSITLGTEGAFTLAATSAGLTTATSVSFTVAGAATKLVITTQPSNATSGVALATQPTIKVEDAAGDVVTTSTASVDLSIGTGTGTLACTADPLAATSGVAAFAGCSITLGTEGAFTLAATSAGLTTATSVSVTVAGAATKLVFTVSPSASTGGTVFGAQPQVKVEDAAGDVVTTSAASVDLSIRTGTGTLACTADPLGAAAGVATFAGCSITLGTEGAFTLMASSAGLTTATSVSFTVAGAATKLVFAVQPRGAAHGAAFATQPVVDVEDAAGDVVTTSALSITLAITPGSGPRGATLRCTKNPLPATNGIATFAGCTLSLAGSYTLTASTAGLTAAVSVSITET